MATVKLNVLCGGTKLKVHSLSLNQRLDWHHTFRVAVSAETLESEKAVNIDNSVSLLGEVMDISIENKTKLSGDGLTFKGIVTSVNIDRSYADDNLIVLSGYSPTYLMEDGLGCQSFEEKKGDAIFKEITSKYPANLLNPSGSGNYSAKIPYLVKYKETNYHFLSRLAATYGEWFYYNGKELVYGKIKDTNQVDVTLGKDLLSFEYGVSLKPSKFKWLSYDYTKNNQFDKSSKSYKPAWLDNYGQKALSVADTKFPGNHKMPTLYDIKEESKLKTQVEISKAAILSNSTTFNGRANNVSITIGTSLSVSSNNKMKGSTNNVFINRFRVVGVQHFVNSNNDYQNEFEALPLQTNAPPVNNNVYKPEAEKNIAVVKENNDPEELGRVRVQFNWQEGKEMTPWIRVATAHAFGDRGVYFIPELEDEVIVDFEQANPDRPYVTNAMYHGKAKPEFFDPDNNFKSIKTRSGHTILLNDEEGKETITILDKNENYILLNTEEKTITISAPEVITLQSEVINLLAGDSINLESKPGNGTGTINIKAEDHITMESVTKDISVEAKAQNVDIKAAQKVEAKGDAGAKLESPMTTEVIGKTSVKVNGTTAEVKATAKLDLKGGAIANLKAAIVKIN